MRTYYRGPDAFVTADRFVWMVDTPRIFPVRDLKEIGLDVHTPGRPATAAAAVSAGLLVFAGASWMTMGVAAGVVISSLAVITMVVAVSSRRSHGERVYRVVATVRGARTVLYESRELRVFNQVTRALRRTVEDGHRDHRGPSLANVS